MVIKMFRETVTVAVIVAALVGHCVGHFEDLLHVEVRGGVGGGEGVFDYGGVFCTAVAGAVTAELEKGL